MQRFVLIDDDKLISMNWKYKSEKANVALDVFVSVDEFLNNFSSYDLETQIYIDSHLGTNLSGEFESKKIFERGFKNLYITTGYTDLDISKYPWIKGVVTKKPPF